MGTQAVMGTWAPTGVCTLLPWRRAWVLQREGESQSAWKVAMYPACLLWALCQSVKRVNECEREKLLQPGLLCAGEKQAGWGGCLRVKARAGAEVESKHRGSSQRKGRQAVPQGSERRLKRS